METTRYWVRLTCDDQVLGAGFFLTRRFVVTAAHCVEAVDVGTRVEVHLEGRSRFAGRVYERADKADLALIEVTFRDEDLDLPVPDVALPDSTWWSPYRPGQDEVHLAGRVIRGQTDYECGGGAIIESVELRTDVIVGDYSGYSGSPVQSGHPAMPPHVSAVLLEQFPDRQDPARSSNVLFGATLDEVFRRFECFDVVHLVDGIRRARRASAYVAPVAQAPPAHHEEHEVEPAQDLVQRATIGLHALLKWENEDLLDPLEARALRVQLARSVVEDMITRRARVADPD